AALGDVEREAGEHVDALRVALEALVDVADLDEGHAGVRGQGSGCGPYAEARPWGVNASHQHQLASRETGTDLAELPAHGTRLDDAGLEPAVPHQPDYGLPIPLAHGPGRNADPQRGGRRGATRRGRALRLEKVHARTHLGKDAGVVIQDADLHLHRRPLP